MKKIFLSLMLSVLANICFAKDKYNPDMLVYTRLETQWNIFLLKEFRTFMNNISLDVKRFERFNVKDNGKIVLCGRYLYQIEVSRDYDIIIQQNTIFKHWNIQINPYTKKFLRTSGYKPNDNLYFSLTAKHDPNLLIRSLQFKISDLLAHDDQNPIIPFKYESESDSNDVSIFTAKYFDSYAHEVI